jgi:uncharacterized protein (DUF2384 family)
MELTELTPAQLRKAADILEQIDAVKGELCQLLGDTPSPAVERVKKHWTQTPEGKARIARVMRASWRRRKART